ncbi:MAG: hypothetical protein A4E42_00933 [Methanoregulaceae archaeon PtaU1.Bin222]|nr:MAG: hypothetical protein A4E42_00933 [Methanoregulaceae archaeon PtaU1.Bin222]
MNPSQQTSLQVLDSLDLMVRLWNIGDIAGLLSHAGRECSGFGFWPGDQFNDIVEFREFLERRAGRMTEVSLSDICVDAIGTISWIRGTCSFYDTDLKIQARGRFSAVLKGTGHAWVLVHLHLSFPSGDKDC